MMRARGLAVAAALALSLLGAARAPAQGSGVARGGIVLTLPTDTRSLGLGHAAAAASPDEWTVFASPGQLGGVRHPSIGLATEAYLAGTRLSAMALAKPLGRGTLGIGATLLDYGSVSEIVGSGTDGDGIETGRTHSAQDNALVVGYGFNAARGNRREVRVGATVALVGSHIADLSGRALAFSAGVAGSVGDGWDLAAAIQHLGADLELGATRGALPATVRLGAAAPSRRIARVSIRPMLELRSVRGAGSAAAIAAEALWVAPQGSRLAFRAGYTVRHGARDDHWPLALGMGIALGSFGLDYAAERFPTIDQVTHRIGLRFAPRAAGSAASERIHVPGSPPQPPRQPVVRPPAGQPPQR